MTNEEFAALFPVTTDPEMMRLTGLSKSGVRHWANRLGLRKSNAHKAATHARTGSARRGENSPAWKGGVTAGMRQADPEYRPWRDAVLKRDGYACTTCGDRRRRSEMHAHHIQGWAAYPALRYVLDNGITLCEPCHRALHGLTTRPRVLIPCKCGCDTMIEAIDKWGIPREWARGHHLRGRTLSPEQRAAIAKGGEKRQGRRHTDQAKAKISATKTGRVYTPAELAAQAAHGAKVRGRKDSDLARAKKTEAHQGKPLSAAHREAIRQGHLRRRTKPAPPPDA